MEINLETFEILTPAFIAAVLIALTHGLLGIKVLERGIVFIDLAIAQIAGLGLVVANILFHENAIYGQLIALSFAISASIFFYFIEKSSPVIQEAIIGCSFVLSACVIILLLANDPHGATHIETLLSGEILFITLEDILKHAPIYILIIAIWFLKPKVRNSIAFYLIFAIIITSSVQLAGIYVVFASLILPAIAARNQTNPILTAWICGIISVILGIAISFFLDLPTGPIIVICYVLVTIIIRFLKNTKKMA